MSSINLSGSDPQKRLESEVSCGCGADSVREIGVSGQLFSGDPERVEPEWLMDGVCLLRAFAEPQRLAPLIESVLQISPLRQMVTSRGFKMSVATSNCGDVGWVSDRKGYRYARIDPETQKPWPDMPEVFSRLASEAATQAGFSNFLSDACLINRYHVGAQMGAHQDKDEQDFAAPIVSVSLGIPARFYMVGPERRGRSTPIDLLSGDVVVFGGPARRHFHGVRKLKPAKDALFRDQRVNLTFRKAL